MTGRLAPAGEGGHDGSGALRLTDSPIGLTPARWERRTEARRNAAAD